MALHAELLLSTQLGLGFFPCLFMNQLAICCALQRVMSIYFCLRLFLFYMVFYKEDDLYCICTGIFLSKKRNRLNYECSHILFV